MGEEKMITIRTLLAQISIDPNKEYAIYDVQYPADQLGHPLPEDSEEVKSLKYYEYGNIVIETERKKYTITSVYCSYNWVANLLDYINAQKNTGDIFVDMFQLCELPDGSFQEFNYGKILVETI